LAIISSNPFPRHGAYTETVTDSSTSPLTTYLYEIRRETSISGEPLYVLIAEIFPWLLPVYAVAEDANAILMLFLRDNPYV
jgi:hypothetical protein